MMEIVSIIWKISYMIHMISNAGFFGSIALAFFDCKGNEKNNLFVFNFIWINGYISLVNNGYWRNG
jgi:hypothetical protein